MLLDLIQGPENAVMTASVVPEKSKEYNDSNTVILLNDGGGRFSPNLLVYSPSSLLKGLKYYCNRLYNVIWFEKYNFLNSCLC